MRSGFARPDPGEFLDAFATAGYGSCLEAAERLHGSARLEALARLDLALTRSVAPAVVTSVSDALFSFSDRVDLRSLAHEPAVADWSIPSLALK